MMTSGGKQRVTLTVSDKLTILGYFATAMTTLAGFGVSVWTRLAVLETKVDAIERRLNPLADDRLSGLSPDRLAHYQNGKKAKAASTE